MASQESPEEEKEGSFSGATDQRVGPSRTGFAASRTCHVLLVEDDEPTRFTISTLLTKCDYKGVCIGEATNEYVGYIKGFGAGKLGRAF